ncbi:MAG: RNA polymerase sigma factor [Deltaproteobacteria bacterium]|nr:RNA polymerase sigma factor [Deltaproteobacteria bacterium]
MDDTRTDEELMEAYASGERGAFEVLFARLAPRLHAFFARSFGRSDAADDCLQTTFVKLHVARGTYRTGARLRPWVFAIAARVRLDELRRRYRLPPTADEDAIDEAVHVPATGHAEAAERAELATRVRAAVEALPESQRVVVLLHRFEGLTFGEIGEALGVSEGAVRIRAFRAYDSLRAKLEDLVDLERRASSEPAMAREPSARDARKAR